MSLLNHLKEDVFVNTRLKSLKGYVLLARHDIYMRQTNTIVYGIIVSSREK